jgi:hypothetical protein
MPARAVSLEDRRMAARDHVSGEAMKVEVLVYPNITYARNLEADSYVVVVGQMIRALNEYAGYTDTHQFTMLLPDHVESLDLPNVRQVPYALPSYPNTMRTHFDAPAFLEAVDWKHRSYDVVWSHLPEHTLAIKNVLYNSTNERPAFVGYSHWWEVPENTAYAETMLMHNYAGMLAMDACGVNSSWVRALVLNHADEYLAEPLVYRLSNIIRPQYLGTHPANPNVPEPGLIAFNHRANEYTGFRWAVERFDDLWRKRQDFRVLFTTADAPDYPWAKRLEARDRDSYLDALSRCAFGVGTFKKYSAWSVSVMDGLSHGVPYILPAHFCYPEMVGQDYPLTMHTPRQFLPLVEACLDSPVLMKEATTHARNAAERFAWHNVIGDYAAMFDEALASLGTVSDTEAYGRVRDLVRRGATKNEVMRALSWTGPRVPWTQYRARLRADGISIKDQDEQLTIA